MRNSPWRDKLVRLRLADLRALRRDPLNFGQQFIDRHGDWIPLRFAGVNILVLSDPDAIAEVLIGKTACFSKGRAARRIYPLVGQGLLTSEGETHHMQRTLAQPAFHRPRINQAVAIMGQALATRMDTWHEGMLLDMSEELGKVTLTIIGQVLFHDDLAPDAALIRASLARALLALRTLQLIPWPQTALRVPTPAARRFWAAKADLEHALDHLLARRATQSAADDLLTDLLTAQRDPDQPYSARTLRDDLLTLILAGHETTANALCWTLYLVTQHPPVATRLVAEVRDVVGVGTVTAAHLAQLTYTRSVFLEALRLYPPVHIIGREAIKPCEIGGRVIQPQTNVLMSPYMVQRDPRWYHDPDQFLPDRWVPAARAARPRHTFFPFGAGPRGCLGESFALTEGVCLLAGLLQSWQFVRETPEPVMPQPLLTLRPGGGMWLRLQQR